MQSAGFSPLLQWAGEANAGTASLAAAAVDACDCCALLWSDRKVRQAMRSRAARNAQRIGELFYTVFPEAPRIERG